MGDILEQLIKLIYNDHKILVIICVATGISLWLCVKILNTQSVKVIFETKYRLNIDKHPMFTNEKRLTALINRYTNIDKVKQDLYRSIMSITMTNCYEYVNKIRCELFLDKETLIKHIDYNVPILKSRNSFIDYCKLDYPKNGIELANYILDAFETIRNRSLQAFELNLNLLATENFQTINQAKYFFFSIAYATLEQSIIDAEVSFQQMNGQIKKIIEKDVNTVS